MVGLNKFIKRTFLISAFLLPIVLYLNRFFIPDTSFDTLNYHLFIGERGLINKLIPHASYEFYPTGLYNFFPFHEVLFYLSSEILGYRLGNIWNLMASILIIIFLYKTIETIYPKFFIRSKLVNFMLFLNTTIVLEYLFQLATYYIDIINSLFAVVGFYFFIKVIKETDRRKQFSKYILIYLLLGNLSWGVALLGKMVNFIYTVSIVLLDILIIFLSENFRNLNLAKRICLMLVSLFLLIIMLITFLFFNFQQTGNPVFPFYNTIFRSKYYDTKNDFVNTDFGGRNLLEKIFWPVFSITRPERLGEIQAMFYDYKFNLYWTIGIILILYLFKKKFFTLVEKLILIFFLISSLIWSFVFGYIRYGIFLEILGSLILIIALNKRTIFNKKFIKILILIFLIIQNLRIIQFNFIYDLSWRPSFIRHINLHLEQIKYVGKNMIDFPDDTKKYLIKTDVVLNCYVPSTGYYALSELKNKPMLLTEIFSNAAISLNNNYQNEVRSRFLKYFKKTKLNFAFLADYSYSDESYQKCIKSLGNRDYSIVKESIIDNFLGYKNKKIKIVFGQIGL